MAMDKNYYDILGITEDEKKLTGDEFQKVCKKKYRELAKTYHPDKWVNGTDQEKKEAEEKFKAIAEAYDVLSDENKRNRYDNGGFDASSYDGFDPMDIFTRMAGFGGFDMDDRFGNFFGRRQNRQRIVKGSDIHTHINLTLQQAYKGGKFKISYDKNVKCNHCHGTGSEDGQEHKCHTCNGSGMVTKTQQMGPGSYSMTSSPCPTCHGTGKEVTTKCTKCGGSGFEKKRKTEEITLMRGLGDNMVVTIPGMGNDPLGNGVPGDMQLHITVKEDSYFKRPDDTNLIHYEDVPFNEALLGFTKEFKCIDGSKVTVNAPELTPDGKAFFFTGKGMPNPNNPQKVGDYAVVIKHKYPDKLTDKQKEILKNFHKNK